MDRRLYTFNQAKSYIATESPTREYIESTIAELQEVVEYYEKNNIVSSAALRREFENLKATYFLKCEGNKSEETIATGIERSTDIGRVVSDIGTHWEDQ